jgi:prepilin peptidase CpaA
MNPEVKAFFELLSMLVADPRTGTLIGLLIAAAWSDYGSGRIPNALVFVGTFAALAYSAMVPPVGVTALQAVGGALGGLACGLALLLPFYLLRAMGAGDVKLMAMTGAFLGFPQTLWAVLGSFLAGGVLSILYLVAMGGFRRALDNMKTLGAAAGAGLPPTLDARRSVGTLPYGIAIAFGTVGYLALHQLGVLG